MKKLILLRHAKSSWDDPALSDHDRPLNKRGRGAAPVIAAWLVSRSHVPDTVLCSSAVRTRETVERMRSRMPDLPEPVVEPTLYHAAPDTLRARLSALPSGCQTVMLVGHQPGIGAFARLLADGTEKRRCKRAYEHFPTAAAAVFEADIEDWSELGPAKARFIDFATPRELIDA